MKGNDIEERRGLSVGKACSGEDTWAFSWLSAFQLLKERLCWGFSYVILGPFVPNRLYEATELHSVTRSVEAVPIVS